MVDLGLKDKVVIVTGINNPMGIGAAAVAFAGHGAKLSLVYKRMYMSFNPAKAGEYGMDWYKQKVSSSADEVEAKIRATGTPYLMLENDVSDENDIKAIFDATEAALGPADILINNHAVFCDNDNIMMLVKANLEHIYAVNVCGTALMMREFACRYHARLAKNGRIINLSTDAAEFIDSQVLFYSSKTAVETLTRSGAMEMAHLGITVNAIAPGPIQTGWLDKAFEKVLLPKIPVGRMGTPEDIVNAILFLVSDKASWITGQIIKVDGGHAV